jgi:CcmD family protein
MPRRLLIALLTLVLTAPALLAQPPQQNEYVPIDQLPPQETLPAAPLLIAAYIVVWLGLMGYLFWIWRRIARVETEMQALQRRTAGQGR